MKKIRIGCGAGCSYDRVEPAVELVLKGNLDYLVFECLAEIFGIVKTNHCTNFINLIPGIL